MKAIKLGSGMTLHMIPSEKFMTDTICILIRRPLSRLEVTANALLPPLLARGSAVYPTVTAVTLAAERMRGSIFENQIIKKGEQQILQFYFECVHDPALQKEGLAFLREMILCPLIEGEGFHPAYVRSESDYLRQRIDGRINNKNEYAKLKCVEHLCEHEPFGLYGDGYTEDISAMTPVSLFRHYKKIIATSPIDFIALGRWDESSLCEHLTDLFSVYRDDITLISPVEVKSGRKERRITQIATGATQGNMCVGLRGEMETTGDGYIHFQLANEILGGGANAKLFTQVREKESLCYRISSFIYRFKGMLCIQCGADAAQFERVLSLIEAQIEAVKRGEITEEELETAKQSLIKRWQSLQDYPSGSIDFYASQYLLGDGKTIDEMTASVAAADKDGVSSAASKLTIDTVVMLT